MNDSHDNGAAGRLAARCERFAELDLLGLHVTADSREYFTDLRAVLAENEAMRGALTTAHQALSRQPASCRWHGIDFDEVDPWLGVPRCESCRAPYRVVKALEAIVALEPSLVGKWQPADPPPSAPMPACAPTPNALICACGRPVGHGKPSTEDAS